jgi:HSP20 family protein
MTVRDLIPWGRSNQAPTVYHGEQEPLLALHRQMNRLFDDVFRGFDLPTPFDRSSSWSAKWPSVEISETDKEVRVIAEVPGLEDKDIDVLLEGDVLILRGEKKSETEDRDRKVSERLYGRFERRIALGFDVEEDKVDAAFKNGVLTVTLPKTATAQAKVKHIAVNTKH